MHRIDPEKAKKLIKDLELVRKSSEAHYLFGTNGIFSFDESEYFCTLIDREKETYLGHVFRQKLDFKGAFSRIKKDQAISLLDKMGYSPFMKLEIDRYILRDEDNDLRLENVEDLGFFVDEPSLGMEKVFYGDLMKQKMIEDQSFHRKMVKEAENILREV